MFEHGLDLGIVLIFLSSTILVGVFARKYIENIADFLVVGRGLGTALAVGTLVASEIGLVTLVYYAEFAYVTGFGALILGLINGVTMWIVGRTGFVVRHLRELRIMTVPEYYQKRYNTKVRVLGGVIAALAGILNQGIFIVIGARFLNTVLGISDIYLHLTMIVLLAIVLGYTMLGGMVSVIINDFIQYVMMAIGMGIVTWFAYSHTGWQEIVTSVQTTYGAEGFDPFLSSKLGIIFILWQLLLWFAVNTIWQTSAMRIFSVKDTDTVKKTLQWSGIAFIGRAAIPMFWGLAALAYFSGRAAVPESLDAWPTMLAEIVPTGLLGLVLAAMIAAFMSTNSCYLLGWSAIITQDVIAPLRKETMSSHQRIVTTRICIIAIGLFLLVWGLWYELPDTAYQYLALTGTIYLSGAFATVVMGIYWKRANVQGAYTALVLAAIIPLLSVFLSLIKDDLPGWLLFIADSSIAGILAFGFAFVGFIAGSLLFGKNQSETSSQEA